MKTTDKTAATTSTPSQLDAIETAALDDVTGGCGACGQACANGPAPAAAGGSRFPARFAALSSFARR
jgi:hypothetical protein